MVQLKTHSLGVWRVSKNDEFIGYLTEDNKTYTFNPRPDITLRSYTGSDWNKMLEWIDNNF